ncbi:L-lactate permease [Actinomyces vulturis]|uniref:L-lactate permease n=1 Tax=Actinomyces vulturis TaxID=1857645 RepID=UPI0008328607|nr:L-lactate permease [Actinomyces vulturis]
MVISALVGRTVASLPMETFTPSTTSVGGNVTLTALVGVIPLLSFFILLGAFKVKTHWCALISLALSIVLAIVAFNMPAVMTVASASQGLALGFVPIIYIIIAAVWLYNLTEVSHRSQDLRSIFNVIGKGDIRIQALLVSFSFCALLEGLAGFGAPVAISSAMLITLGVPKIRAALLAIVGNAIFVGFGAMSIPITTAGKLGGVAPTYVATVMGHLASLITLFIPFVLLFIMDGFRGIRQVWPLALVAGGAASIGMFVTSMLSYELTDVAAALLSFAAAYAFLQVWTPKTAPEMNAATNDADSRSLSRQRVVLALLPYVLVVVIIAITKLWTIGVDLKDVLKATDIKIQWPGVYGSLLTDSGKPSSAAIYSLSTLSNPGTWILVTGLIVTVVYAKYSTDHDRALPLNKGLATLPTTIYNLRWAIVTIGAVMALAYVMNFSGQTTSIGAALAQTGAAFAFLAPILGWTGTAVAGSATSAGALFANLQATAAAGAGLNPGVLLAANTVGGGLGKIVSPQNLAIVATSVEAEGSEAEILRKAVPYSLVLLLVLCTLVFAASQGWFGAYIPALPAE